MTRLLFEIIVLTEFISFATLQDWRNLQSHSIVIEKKFTNYN